MTKSKKIGISIAFALIFVLTCAMIVPMCTVNNSNVADAVTVQSRGEWYNTYDGDYYEGLNTNSERWGTTFYNDLANWIAHTKNPSYDDLKEIFKTSDADPNQNGNVIWFYTGNSIPYTGAMDSGSYRTNREHIWPKMGGDAFPQTSEAGSDAHHLRPLNTQLNNTRSNYHFGEVAQTVGNRVLQDGPLANYGTSDPDTWCYLSGGYFYPAKGYRGATARILFYVQTRWGKKSNLSFTLGSGSAKVMSNVDILMKWHLEEPPTDEEIRRNEAVYQIQKNRNPFIDHPEYAEMIYCYDGKSYNNTLQDVVARYGSYLNANGGGTTTPVAPTSITLSATSLNLTVGQQSSKITVTASPSRANNSVIWATSDGNVATVNDGVVTALALGTATITAISTEDPNVRATLTVNVISRQANLDAFAESMSALDNAQTMEQRFDAIRSALNAYNQMTGDEQSANATSYAKLQEALIQYNQEVNVANDEFESANNLAAQIMANGLSASFMALVAIVVQQLLWR